MTKPTDSHYAQMLWKLMRRPDGRMRSIRELARFTGSSHEHLRRILAGQAAVDADVNKAIARVLQASEQELWAAAVQDRITSLTQGLIPQEAKLPIVRLWDQLGEGDRKVLLRVADALVVDSDPITTAITPDPIARRHDRKAQTVRRARKPNPQRARR
jgi:transcriptional regulator with XRE-family HTH domain